MTLQEEPEVNGYDNLCMGGESHGKVLLHCGR